MEKTKQPVNQQASGLLLHSPDKTTVWLRELFLLFYLGYFFTVFLFRLFSDSHITNLLMKGASIVYAPGMIFAAGCLMGIQNFHEKNFKKDTLKKAWYAILLFYVIGFLYEVFINDRASFATIKDLLAVLRVPNLVSIFLTLSVCFLLCSFFWPWIEKSLQKPFWAILLCFIGFLCTFLPYGLLGYGAIGVFIGGDRFGCIPLFQYFFVFYAGIFTARSLPDGKKKSILHTCRKGFLPVILCFLLGGIFIFLHWKQQATIFLGTGCAGICIFISIFFLPVYQVLETWFLQLVQNIRNLGQKIEQLRKTKKAFYFFFYFVGYVFLFLIVAFFIFAPYSEGNRTLIWSVDGLGQYVPKVHRFLSYIPSVFQDILHGNFDFQQYDFTSGLGATVAISFDPIYWLYLLFHPSQVETAYSLMIVLRYFLAGASMSALVLYFNKSSYAAYISSIVYAFSGYAIYAGTRHGQFLTPLILLPVLVIAMEQLISKKKWYLLTILTAISLLCSYYFLYMNTIALGIYFIIRIVCTKEYRNFKTFFTRGCIIVGSYVLGVSIGIISIFTSFGSYMGSSRTGGSKLSDFLSTTPLYYRKEWLSDFFISFVSDSFTPGMWLKLGFAPLALFALILLFTRKNKKELKPIFLIFTLFCFFPIFGFVFSGFSSVTNRWCYIYAAIIAFILAENIEFFTHLTAKEIQIMLGMISLYAGIIFFSTKYRTDQIFGVFGLLMLTFALLLTVNHDKFSVSKKMTKSIIFTITILSVIINANIFMTSESEDETHMETYVAYGDSMKQMSQTALQYLDDIDPNTTEFYRSTNLKTYGNTRSSSLIYGYNDISTFTSTLNGGIVDYNRAMGNCDWNIVSIYSYNARTYMHELASIRYIGTSDEVKLLLPYGYKKVYDKETKKNTYSIYENEYALPLGYTYDSVTRESDAEKLSAAQKQELTMLSAIVEDDKIPDNQDIKTVEQLPLTAKKLNITKVKAKKGVQIQGDSIIIGEEGGSLTFSFEGEPNAETYLSLKGDLYAPKDAAEHFLQTQVKTEDGVSYQYKFRIDSYSTDQEEFLFNLGYRENSLHSCTLKFKKAGTIKFDDISVYSQSMDSYADRVHALQENTLQDIRVDTNTVTGKITVDENKMLVLSLPYQSGWTAWVDGKEVPIQKVNYQYMGLSLTPGSHDIRLHYSLPGLSLAFTITAAGIVLFVFIILFNAFRKHRRRKNS